MAKPERVRRAQLTGDTEALSAMGRKGAEIANRNREIEATFDQVHREESEEFRRKQSGEDCIPLDSHD